jgi:hypothetical protein
METTTFIVQMAKCTECLDEMTDKRNKEQQTNQTIQYIHVCVSKFYYMAVIVCVDFIYILTMCLHYLS